MITRKLWLWAILLALPLAAAGAFYASSQVSANERAQTYICPLTGEELNCPKCCPLTERSLCEDFKHGEDE